MSGEFLKILLGSFIRWCVKLFSTCSIFYRYWPFVEYLCTANVWSLNIFCLHWTCLTERYNDLWDKSVFRIRVCKFFWPHGSGFFHDQAKIVRKTFISTVLLLLCDFLSLNNDVNVPSKSNIQKNFFLLVFCWHLEGEWRKNSKKQDPDP
jgi:hypothetical protein